MPVCDACGCDLGLGLLAGAQAGLLVGVHQLARDALRGAQDALQHLAVAALAQVVSDQQVVELGRPRGLLAGLRTACSGWFAACTPPCLSQ